MALAGSTALVLLLAVNPAVSDAPSMVSFVQPAAPDTTDSTSADTLTADSLAASSLAAAASDTALTDTAAADTALTDAASSDTMAKPDPVRAVPDATIDNPVASVLPGLDTVRTDSTAADSAVADTARRVRRYIDPLLQGRTWERPNPFDQKSPFLFPGSGQSDGPSVSLDSSGTYTLNPSTETYDSRYPVTLDRTDYRQERRRADMRDNWRSIAEQRQREQDDQSGLGVNIVVPGGQQSAFSTIFGKPEVDLRVNGQADINAGFDYRKSDQQVTVGGNAGQFSPNFKQDLRLGITGSIGDKMQIDVNWDTNNQFDYQNQVKLQYTGYEDEILQSVEAGNVFLETPSTLIRGGQSLFGIKSELQLGNVRVTTVASQQEGQSQSLSIEGGSETTEFSIKPTEYDDNRHYFLGYYFRNRWNDALSEPPNPILFDGFSKITDIEVWKLRTTNTDSDREGIRKVVGLVDLGEPVEVLTQANNFTEPVLPNDDGSSDIDQYTQANLETLRDGSSTTQPQQYVTTQGNLQQTLTGDDYQVGDFKKLQEGRDYTLNGSLGYISLNQRLQSNQALAVAFRYQANGRTYTVGNFSSEGGGTSGSQNADRLVLKLLRPTNLSQPSPENNPAAWYLQLRNIYRLRGSNFNPQSFELDVLYDPSGQTPSNTIPEISAQDQLLGLLGLDRLNTDGAPSPDNKFDYIDMTIKPSEGLLIFPYLEPFGQRISDVIDQEVSSGTQRQQLKDQYVFSSLYTEKRENASRNKDFDIYRIDGEYKSDSKSFYDLKAFAGIVEGSVEVTAGGTPLQEGTDYIVDYQGGTVTITNPTYTASGRTIDINYEQNSFANLQQKTLLGARADYSLRDRFSLGATVMRLSQKSPIDKYRIGEEPIKNTIWGVDGSLNLEPRWLTRAVDLLPLVQTKSQSTLSLSGEFAQLSPGQTTTDAFDRARDRVQEAGRDFSDDQLGGISYLDDFEGFENTFSLKQQLNNWQISAPPDSIGRYPFDEPGLEDDSLRTNWRGSFGWYRLNQNIIEQVSGEAEAYNEAAIELVDINDVFPNRDTQGEVDPTLTTLDLYFNPNRRGPYNYTKDLQSFVQNPKDVWGGFTQRLPDGYNDFSLQNVEFVEFIFKPYPENAQEDAGKDAKLYVDLGSVSEDVVPNSELNQEDGLSTTSFNPANFDTWGRLPSASPQGALDINEGRTEDLGLDGVVSYNTDPYPPIATEATQFSDFLSALPSGGSAELQAAVARARRDPSADDYRYFAESGWWDDSELYPGGASFQERFSRWYAGQELNGFETQNQLAQGVADPRGNSRNPDTEDLNRNSAIDTENNYFQYEVPLSKAALDSLARPERSDDYIVSEIQNNNQGTGWYKVRIPIRDFTRRVGNIQDFTLVESIRLWTTGHEVPITLRMATLELVGSQWRTSTDVAEDDTLSTPPDEDAALSVTSINNEEDAIYQIPRGAIVSQTRNARGGTQNSREQALVLGAENLRAGRQLGVFKTFSQGYDLLKYSNLRMFAHLNGTLGDGARLSDLSEEEGRSKARLFVRLGSNQTNDYYEYEQPLTPTDPTMVPDDAPDQLWRPQMNSMNLRLSALNELKVFRDQDPTATRDSVFWNVVDGQLRTGAPDAEEFAPEGTRLAIKGTPSLQDINTIVVGIRNPASPDEELNPENVLREATIWVNELRVSGYRDEGGWAAVANADVKLADLGGIQGSFQRQTAGFGSLSSTLADRDQRDVLNWNMTANLNADKLLPERFGWSIPLSMQMQSQTQTPTFAPSRGDVQLSTITDQIDNRSDLSEAQRDSLKTAAIQSAQTRNVTQSFTARLQKQGSDSWLARNTLDAISLNYSYANTDSRSPSQRINDSWRWSSTFNYQLSINQPHTVRPLWFLDGAPLIGGISDLQFNYAPQSVSFTGSATRRYSERRARPSTLQAGLNDPLPDRISNPFREQQSFSHQRSFSLQYNPFNFLNLSFDTNTDQSLSEAGADSLLNIVTSDGRVFTNVDTTTFFDNNPELHPDSVGIDFYYEERVDPRREGRIVKDLFTGERDPRTNAYEQRFTGTLRPSILGGETFNFIDLQDIVYQSSFTWENGPIGRLTGATASNDVQIRSGVVFHPQQFWRKFGFYRRLEEQANDDGGGNSRRRPPPEDEESGDGEGDDEDGGLSFSDLPVPNPLNILRRIALTFTGIRDFSVTYTAGRVAQSNNVGTFTSDSSEVAEDYSLLSAFRGDGPSLGYRFGLQRRIGDGQRLFDATRQATDFFRNTNRLQARTTLTPSQNFRVSLNWNMDWGTSSDVTFRPLENGGATSFRTEQGTNTASVWAFGGSYIDLLKDQINTFRADDNASDGGETLGDANQDGRVALTNNSVSKDFRDVYLSGLGSVGRLGLLPVPMPGWNVNYTGLSSWPLVRALTRSVTVRHGYTADYNSGYQTATGDSLKSFSLGNRTIEFARPDFNVGTMQVNERFQPLIGVDISWLGNFQTNVAWNQSNAYRLSTTGLTVEESETEELTFSASFRQQGLDIPLLPVGRLNNQISFNLTVSRAINDVRSYSLNPALASAATDPEFNPQDALQGDTYTTPTEQTTRLTVTPEISYQFSNRVSADFQLKYEQFNSQDSSRPSFTNVSGGFFVRVNVSGS